MSDRAAAALHEACHACAAAGLNRKVRWARVAVTPIPGQHHVAEHGACSIDRGGEWDCRDVVISLAPGLYESDGLAVTSGSGSFGVWPPLFEALKLDAIGDRRQVAALVALLGLDEAAYDRCIARTREILDDSTMRRWIGRVASHLERDGYIDGEQIAALRPSTRKEIAA